MDNKNTNAENIGESGNAAKLPVSRSESGEVTKDEYIDAATKKFMADNPQAEESYCRQMAEKIWALRVDWYATH